MSSRIKTSRVYMVLLLVKIQDNLSFTNMFFPKLHPVQPPYRPSESLSTFASWPSLLFWGVQCRMGSKQASTSGTKTMSTSTTQDSSSFQNHREHHQDRIRKPNIHTIHRANAFKEPAILKSVGNSSKLSLKSHLYVVLIALEENNGPGHDVTAVIPITPSISPRSPLSPR